MKVFEKMYIEIMSFGKNNIYSFKKDMTKKMANVIVPYLTIDRFAFDVGLILLAKKNGFKISELPVVLQSAGKSNLKIIFDDPQMLNDVFKIIKNNRKGLYNLKS